MLNNLSAVFGAFLLSAGFARAQHTSLPAAQVSMEGAIARSESKTDVLTNAETAPDEASPIALGDGSFGSTPYSGRNSGSFGSDFTLISFAYGLPNWLYHGYGSPGGVTAYKRSGIGPIMARVEVAIREEVGIAVLAQVATKRWRHGGFTDRARAIGLGAMGFYHANKLIPLSKLDLYAGAGLGVIFRHFDYDEDFPLPDTDNKSDVDLDPLIVVGGRYYVNPSFGVFAEAGYTALSSFNLGVTLKL